jgi:membrane protein YqaA with SNARE-associated domain
LTASADPTGKRPNLRAYFYFVAVYLSTLVALVFVLESRDGMLFLLTLSLAYYSLCCTFIPLPTTAIMVWLNWAEVDPFLAATVASCGTVLANLFDYHVITYFMGYPFVERVRRTKLYAVAVRWFDKRPLLTITVWNFIPFSMDVARWVACMRAYPRARFMLGAFLGRWPRYVLIGMITRWFGLDERVVALLLVLTAAAGIVRALLYLWHFLRQRRRLDPVDTDPDAIGDALDEQVSTDREPESGAMDDAGRGPG